VFWFHPAIWWLLGEIGLAREQAGGSPGGGGDQVARGIMWIALLAIAGAQPRPDLALAAAVPAQEALEAKSHFSVEGGSYVEDTIDIRGWPRGWQFWWRRAGS